MSRARRSVGDRVEHPRFADQVAREVVEPGEPALAAIVETFGREVLDADGALVCTTGATLVHRSGTEGDA